METYCSKGCTQITPLKSHVQHTIIWVCDTLASVPVTFSLDAITFSHRDISFNIEKENLLQELHEAVSDGMKVIVVKKRQLQLYAGQPFADVETALHSLVEGDQSASTANSR